MKIIALEEHFWTPAIGEANAALSPDRQDASLSLARDQVNAMLLDLGESRLRAMDAAGVDVAVLSVTTPATQSLPGPEAVRLAREANDTLARAVAAHPDRYLGFATLPTPDPREAAREFERCVRELGFRGAMVNGRTGEKYLDHADFLPLLEVAAGLEVPVYLHPQTPPAAVRQAYYTGFGESVDEVFATFGWGWHIETAINALRLILSGVFDRLPTLQIVLGHWGELIPFYLERLEIFALAKPRLERPVPEYFRRHFHVTSGGILSVPMLLHAVAVLGTGRILSAMDYPFVPAAAGAARTFLENAPISPADREKIAHGNAETLLRIR